MKHALIALALAAGCLAAPSFAAEPTGTDTGMTMEVGLSMIELSAQRELDKVGLDKVDVMGLTLSQIAQIKLVANSADTGNQDMKRRIEQILAK